MQPEPEESGVWWQVLWIGFMLYVIGIFVLGVTGNVKLFPAVAMIGNFLVPVVYVFYIFQHRRLSQLSLTTTAMSFFYGGILGVFMAALVEPIFIRKMNLVGAFQVGLIEEFSKIIGVLVIAQHRRHTSELNGLILGAAAGMGFAAFESTGYAFSALISSNGDYTAAVAVTMLRGLVAPLGHGTWTAILAAILFRESAARRFRIDARLVGAYLLVSGLHGLWNGVPSVVMSLSMSGATILPLLLVVGGIGLFILYRIWREAVRRQLTWTTVAKEDEPEE